MKTKECIDPEVAEEIENNRVVWRQLGCLLAITVVTALSCGVVASCAGTRPGEIPSEKGKIGEASGLGQTGSAIDLISIAGKNAVITQRWLSRVSHQGLLQG